MARMTEPGDQPLVGILGGGQLAQMLAEAAANLPARVRVLVKNRPAALPGLEDIVEGDANDPDTAAEFARGVDLVTLENEFVNPDALAAIEKTGTPLLPSLASLLLMQDKWQQKKTLIQAGLPVTPCQAVESADEVKEFAGKHAWPVVLKRRHMGYDGKGNATVDDAGDLPDAWQKLHNQQGLFVEAFCPFERELAVMVARSINGETAVYPVVETIQQHHICHVVRAPAPIPQAVAAEAARLALAAIEAIDGIGVMGVELFQAKDGTILINELAPRVHNSGHYTIEGCHCSQFENHLRAILGLPLGSTALSAPAAVMVNLLGHGEGPGEPTGLVEARSVGGAHLHLYGKASSMPGRKMGHVTALGETLEQAEAIARGAAQALRFGG
ncbi:MAG: 5-(carboxyamino)imidazole ribonucleotide synthase [Kiritimatiellia bacterium]